MTNLGFLRTASLRYQADWYTGTLEVHDDEDDWFVTEMDEIILYNSVLKYDPMIVLLQFNQEFQ